MLWRLLDNSKPDLFVTLQPFFRMKLNTLLDEVTKNGIFVMVAASVYEVEFQNRGPHAHILIILKDHGKPRNASDYDKFVSAEIPDTEMRQ
ncbi:Helitron helicase [Phytophthora megakarya]|uniref:Helitron helicase n=1 Tax=Phytophthora megakarya TaxID=4795 RepID=A0A225W3B7_9STRA|nr:Helitron helicase [Phytophthora megakarya]